MKTCFMCDEPATTKDHIPPKCFFPEQKDTGTDYKKNLITVPACNTHNLRTSLDDEYLLGIVAFHWRNNPVAYTHSTTKIKRAMRYRKQYYDLFFGEGKHQILYWQNEKLVTVPIDISRFIASMQKMARGIYFVHFGRKWLRDVDIQPVSLVAVYKESHPIITALTEITQQMHQQMQRLCMKQTSHGSNPDVFYYQLAHDEPPTDIIMRMVFYSGFEVIAILHQNRQDSF